MYDYLLDLVSVGAFLKSPHMRRSSVQFFTQELAPPDPRPLQGSLQTSTNNATMAYMIMNMFTFTVVIFL